jgi:hypothetical protein
VRSDIIAVVGYAGNCIGWHARRVCVPAIGSALEHGQHHGYSRPHLAHYLVERAIQFFLRRRRLLAGPVPPMIQHGAAGPAELHLNPRISRKFSRSSRISSSERRSQIDHLSVLVRSELALAQDGIVVFAVASAFVERIKWTQEGRGFETKE